MEEIIRELGIVADLIMELIDVITTCKIIVETQTKTMMTIITVHRIKATILLSFPTNAK